MRSNNFSKKDWNLISSRKGKGLKVKPEGRVKIVKRLQAHPDVMVSPLKRETIPRPRPTDPRRTVRKNELLLQTSVRELHSDLSKPEIGLPEIAVRDDRKQVSDAVFREILPCLNSGEHPNI